MGRGGGTVVIEHIFCSDDPSSNPAEVSVDYIIVWKRKLNFAHIKKFVFPAEQV